jgi:hypothetical protein
VSAAVACQRRRSAPPDNNRMRAISAATGARIDKPQQHGQAARG